MLEKIRHRGLEGEDFYHGSKVRLGEVNFRREHTGNIFQQGYGIVLDGRPLWENRALNKKELLDLYLEQGPGFVRRLEGKFAFIISNGEDILAARDVFGIKPLYLLESPDGVFMASEMKALVDLEGGDIKAFPPGYCYTGKESLQLFKEIPGPAPRYDLKLEETRAHLRNAMYEAVEKALNTGLKTGVFLSGGVDSSIVASILKHVKNEIIYTYVAGLEGSPDLENARKVAEYLGTEHSEYVYNSRQMWELLPEVIYYLESFDVELIHSSIANYFVSRLAQADGVKIILSGEGADELFGGYHHLKEYKNHDSFDARLRELLKGMHSGGFQRVDRMSRALSLDVEMPFMYPPVVNLALQLPPHWKITGEEMGKWILRSAFDEDIPGEILWRRKAQFGVGSGTEKLMHDFVEEEISDEEFIRVNREEEAPINFKSKEEYYYYKIFRRFYPASAALTVNRWLVT